MAMLILMTGATRYRSVTLNNDSISSAVLTARPGVRNIQTNSCP